MIATLCTFLALLATSILGQDSLVLAPPSPCPTVFTYDLPGPEPGRWSGVVNLSTDSLLHSLWLDIVLDSQAFKLLHKMVEVFTEDFKNFRIENEDMQIQPGVPISLSFTVQYDRNDEIPRVQVIRLNGVVICNALSVEEQTDSRLKTNINSNIRVVINPSRQSINHGYPRPDNRSDPGNIVCIIPLCTFLAWLAAPTLEQDSGSTPISPCPKVFNYEPPGSEPGRWYGEIRLSTVHTLHSLWLNIVLDNNADILGNWVGNVTTTDNKNFKIKNVTMRINPGPAVPVRIFVQYNPLKKIPNLVIIRLNGREICNANTPQPAGSLPDLVKEGEERRLTQTHNFGFGKSPYTSRNEISLNIPSGDPQNRDRDNEYLTTPRPPVSPSGDPQNRDRAYNGYLTTPQPDWRPIQSVKETDNDYWSGPAYLQLPALDIIYNPGEQSQCGKVISNPVPLVVNGTATLEGQWPWQIALYQIQTVDIKYICGGTLVTHKHVITAAHCVTRKMSQQHVDPNTLMIFLGKHNLRTSVEGVQIKIVKEIIVNPSYNSSLFRHDVAILELREPVTYSDYVRPACLWPDNEVDLKNVIGKTGSVVGWGFDETGKATEDLRLVEMPVVSQETCIKSYREFFTRFTSDYTYCAGYREGSSVCNGDSGGGMVFRMNGIWYLRGLVSLSVGTPKVCRIHYVIFTDLAKFLPWIYATVSDF